MDYIAIYNTAKGSTDLKLRLMVACVVWAASVGELPAETEGRAKKVSLAKDIVVEPETAATRLTWYVALAFAEQEQAEFADAELQPVVNTLLDKYAMQRAD